MKKTFVWFSVCFLVLCIGTAALLSGCSGKRDMIGGERAIELAAEHCDLEKDDCTVLSVELDDGKYEVNLVFNNQKYEVEIDAYTGKLVSKDIDYKDGIFDTGKNETGVVEGTTGQLDNTPDKKITVDEAKEIAIKHFNLNADDCRFARAEPDGRKYDVEFVCGQKEYDVEIDAYTGEVLESDVDSVFD